MRSRLDAVQNSTNDTKTILCQTHPFGYLCERVRCRNSWLRRSGWPSGGQDPRLCFLAISTIRVFHDRALTKRATIPTSSGKHPIHRAVSESAGACRGLLRPR